MTLVVFCSILPLLKGSGGVKELLTFLRVEKGANYFSVLKKRERMTTQRAFIRLLESPEGVLLFCICSVLLNSGFCFEVEFLWTRPD